MKEATQARGRVEFQDVTFSYHGAERPALSNITFCSSPGKVTAIIGGTGAGKSTLVNLIPRFYDVDRGHVLVDRVETREMSQDCLRAKIGFVPQKAVLFAGTVSENLRYGKEDATDEKIVRSSKAAYADHFVRTLPDGYNTVLNEEATNISQGQKQLLTIARALLADPEILILDEATSSVDTRTELLIQDAMSRLMKGRTSFVIAHRLSTIRCAELFLVMNHGAIIEKGTHEGLLAQNGFYADLYNSQFRGRVLEEEPVLIDQSSYAMNN